MQARRPFDSIPLKKGLSYDDYLEQSYYGRYKAVSFDALAERFSERLNERSLTLILDIGKPPADSSEDLMTDIYESIVRHNIPKSAVIIRVQREKDIELAERLAPDIRLAYFLPPCSEEERAKKFKSVSDCCKRHGIDILSMSADCFDETTASLCKKQKLKPLVLSNITTGDIYRAYELGAAYVGSHYISPGHMSELMG